MKDNFILMLNLVLYFKEKKTLNRFYILYIYTTVIVIIKYNYTYD